MEIMYEKEFKLAKKLIRYVGKHIINHSAGKVSSKGKFDFVTDKDFESEQYLINNIKKSFANDNFLTEESYSQSQILDRTWIIDPIDGTHNFMNNFHIFCVQLAFYDAGNTQFSIIYIPKLNEIYYAIKNEGAYLNGKRLKINPQANLESMLVVADFSRDTDMMELNFKIMMDLKNICLSFRDMGSYGCETAFFASRRLGIFYHVNKKINAWDIMPGELICVEAGAISIYEKYKDIVYNVIAINTTFAEKVEKIIKNNIDKLSKN